MTISTADNENFIFTGSCHASSAVVKEGLGVKNHEEIIGYLYVGTPSKGDRPLKPISTEDFFSPWPGKE